MKNHQKMKSLQAAKMNYEAAAERAQKAVEKALPIGQRVSWGSMRTVGGVLRQYRHYGEVTAHGHWWSDPFRIAVRNDKTGKIVRISLVLADDDDSLRIE